MQYVPASEFPDLQPKVDVRSPGEFALGHIPGATNIPLFSDEERAAVGTLYKQTGREEAIDKGFEIAGPKMQELAQQARAVAVDGQLAVYCWRGGMRSRHMAQLFEMAELHCRVLEGGYKGYRSHAREWIEGLEGIAVLAGPTGSGKTELLHALAAAGEQVIDLEALAHHRGSAFGAIALPPQPTTEHFHNKVFEAFRPLDPSKRIWVESESKPIGRVYIDDVLWEKMNAAPVYAIDIPREQRIAHITEQYGDFPKADLVDAVQRIAPRLGDKRMQLCIDLIERDEMASAVDCLLQYYDKGYLNSRKKHKKQPAVEVVLTATSMEERAQQLLSSI